MIWQKLLKIFYALSSGLENSDAWLAVTPASHATEPVAQNC